MIRINDKYVYKWTYNCGPGTNTREELLGVWDTLSLAVRLNIDGLQVYGDSKIVIDWLNNRGKLHVLSLVRWKDRIKDLTLAFNSISFTHIYREQNKEADYLSKKALQMQEGKISYNKWIEGNKGPPLFLNLY